MIEGPSTILDTLSETNEGGKVLVEDVGQFGGGKGDEMDGEMSVDDGIEGGGLGAEEVILFTEESGQGSVDGLCLLVDTGKMDHLGGDGTIADRVLFILGGGVRGGGFVLEDFVPCLGGQVDRGPPSSPEGKGGGLKGANDL